MSGGQINIKRARISGWFSVVNGRRPTSKSDQSNIVKVCHGNQGNSERGPVGKSELLKALCCLEMVLSQRSFELSNLNCAVSHTHTHTLSICPPTFLFLSLTLCQCARRNPSVFHSFLSFLTHLPTQRAYVCVCACVRACVHARVCTYVHACPYMYVV